jgi:predicted TIM-barrel fold metal-dependent hydrolase
VPNHDNLRQFIDTLEIIDTHEHLPNESEWASYDRDVLAEWLAHYFCCDLVSAGLPRATLDNTVMDCAIPLSERWEIIAPYWKAASNTGYARVLEIAARDLYGIDRIDAETLPQLDTLFRERRAGAARGESYYRKVLKEKSKIVVSLNDRLEPPLLSDDRDFFAPVYRIEGLIDICTPEALVELAEAVGFPVHTLDDFADSVAASVEKAIESGAVALKVPHAYSRPIHFAKRTRTEAEEAFNAIFDQPFGKDVGPRPDRPLHALTDYMMHHVLRLADRRGLVVQVHTGLQEGNGNIIANSNPELLVNLLLEYSNVTFDIFHMSYPYQQTLSAIAKNFRNVTVDMCWAQICSPEAAVRALVEYLDTFPANKISAFGGDYLFPDGVYGHQAIARENVAKALAIKVDEGTLDLDRAKEIATWVFYENPKRIFRLET